MFLLEVYAGDPTFLKYSIGLDIRNNLAGYNMPSWDKLKNVPILQFRNSNVYPRQMFTLVLKVKPKDVLCCFICKTNKIRNNLISTTIL